MTVGGGLSVWHSAAAAQIALAAVILLVIAFAPPIHGRTLLIPISGKAINPDLLQPLMLTPIGTGPLPGSVVVDVPGEVIAWQSTEDAPVPNSGRVTFRDAPGGRGTQVELRIAYDPPGGAVGQMAAKLFQREPNIQARRELKRFKQLMEAGEIATAEPGPAAPRGE